MRRVFACSDLHGMYGLWKQIENYLQEEDWLIFLGDAADRGPDGLRIMLEMLADPRVTYLMGNHEQMMVEVASEYLEGRDSSIGWWLGNGGGATLNDFTLMPPPMQHKLLSLLSQLDKSVTLKNKNDQLIFLSHAGTSFEAYAQCEVTDYLWDREHIQEPWKKGYNEELYIIHGHTPVSILNKWIGGTYSDLEIRRYCNNHKIDIDLGCFATKRTALLDLNTLEPIYFEEK